MANYEPKNITDQSDLILGVAFGEILTDPGVIVMDLCVRTIENGLQVEGKRGATLTPYEILSALLKSTPSLLQMMVEQRADVEVLPPAFGPIPHWNSGRTLKETCGELFVCTGIGFRNVLPEYGSIVAYIEASLPEPGAETYGADYLLPYKVLRELNEHLPKVLRKMEQKGIEKQKRYFS